MSNRLKYIILSVFIVIAVAFLLVWAGVIPGLRVFNNQTIKKVSLTMWGVDDDSAVYQKLIDAYKADSPGVNIAYQQKPKETYEEDLIRAFAAGKGPDIFGINHNWLARYGDILSPAPKDIFQIADYRSSFLDITQRDFTIKDEIFGVSLYVDTLGLYYNTEMFNSAGIINPPQDWDEFVDISRRLTKRTPSGGILISGAALGAAKNISSAPDILALLMIQNSVLMSDANGRINLKASSGGGTQQAEKALDFYTAFAKPSNPNYSWSKDSKLNSEEAFAQNKVAMMIGYSGTGNNLIRKNPRLRFSVAPIPQMKNSVFHKNYPAYWGFGVYKSSPKKEAAWNFLKFISQPDISRYYLSTTKKPASRKSLVAEQQGDSRLGVFATQALTAYSWTQFNEKAIYSAFSEMIEAQISSDETLTQTIQKTVVKLNSMMKK